MADVYSIKKSTLDAIGNAIRTQEGSTEKIPVDELAERILAIETGGVTASTTAKSGVTYTEGIADLDAATIHMIARAISDNSDITKETMSVYVDYGANHRKISVGDQVAVSMYNYDYALDVLGFNHDTLTNAYEYEGATTATGLAGMSLQMHNTLPNPFNMNVDASGTGSSNTGGWKNASGRDDLLYIKDKLPDDWRVIVKPVNKKAGTGGGSTSGTVTVSDELFLLSEAEVFGSTTYSVTGEGSQYAYYKEGNPAKKNSPWWLRSPRSGNSTDFCAVNDSGNVETVVSASYGSHQIAFAFCV